jgi:hypothetical protein
MADEVWSMRGGELVSQVDGETYRDGQWRKKRSVMS